MASINPPQNPIHIKKTHEGLFTKQAQRAGMSVQVFAKHVLANPNKYDEATQKRARFATNAKKFSN